MKIGVLTLYRGDVALIEKVRAQVHGWNPEQFMGVVPAEVGGRFVPDAKPGSREAGIEKCDYIVSLYNRYLPGLTDGTDAVLIYEDDIRPPDSAFPAMVAALTEAAPNVAGIVSIYPHHFSADAGAIMRTEYGLPPSIQKLPRTVFEVWGGGVGFSLWRSSVLKKCLPVQRDPGTVDWETSMAGRLSSFRLRTLCHGGVRCGHGKHPAPA